MQRKSRKSRGRGSSAASRATNQVSGGMTTSSRSRRGRRETNQSSTPCESSPEPTTTTAPPDDQGDEEMKESPNLTLEQRLSAVEEVLAENVRLKGQVTSIRSLVSRLAEGQVSGDSLDEILQGAGYATDDSKHLALNIASSSKTLTPKVLKAIEKLMKRGMQLPLFMHFPAFAC